MAVQAVHLEADAFLVCLNHALSTEKEEVMGLCIGEVPLAEGRPREGRVVACAGPWDAGCERRYRVRSDPGTPLVCGPGSHQRLGQL